jgi:hypothetical protein
VRLLFRPIRVLPLHIFLRLNTFPNFAMQPAQILAVITRFRHEQDMPTANSHEEMISRWDVEFFSHSGGNGDLVFLVHLDPKHHHGSPFTQDVSYRQLARAVLQSFGDVRGGDFVGGGEVGDGAGEFDDAVVGAGGEVHLAGGGAH